MLEAVLYTMARTMVALLQALPINLVARLGRLLGGLFWLLDARHRKVAFDNVRQALGNTLSPAAQRAVVLENFKRIGENWCCAVKTAGMNFEAISSRVEFDKSELIAHPWNLTDSNVIVVIGHFGNFELFGHFDRFTGFPKTATTYRGLKQPSLNRLMQSLRAKSGCRFFERRTEASALKAFLASNGSVLGLLSDQHAGDRGLPVPFFGRVCSTSAAPAVLALRYKSPLHAAFCYRTGLARWRIEITPEIPTKSANGDPRTIMEIALDMNRVIEAAVRKDPANWFWVHNRWKKTKRQMNPPGPATTLPDPLNDAHGDA